MNLIPLIRIAVLALSLGFGTSCAEKGELAKNQKDVPSPLTKLEIVEIVRQEAARTSSSGNFEVGPPRFSGGKWVVVVTFMPMSPVRGVFYYVSPEGKIIGRQSGY